MEIRTSDSAATNEDSPPIIVGTHLTDDRQDGDGENDVAIGGDDVRELPKPTTIGEQDELMKDVGRVSDAGVEGGKDVDLVADGEDCGVEVRDGGVVGDLISRVSGVKNEGKDSEKLNNQSSGIVVDEVDDEEEEEDPVEVSVSVSGSDVRDEESEGEDVDRSVSRYDSLLSKFDNYATGGGSSTSRASTFGFKVGDLVWGKVKSHPWWPGHIFDEAFALSSVRRTRRNGHILVAFFGDSSYGWFDPAELVPFDEHFAEKSRQTSAKSFIKAVGEAVDEVCRRRSLGLLCKCRNQKNFRPANEEGYFAVDLEDYVAVYPQTLLDQSRDRFQPLETVRFISQLARRPLDSDHKSLGLSQNKAVAMALRKAMFEEFDDTYSEAFGYPPERPIRAPKNFADDSLRMQAQAQLSGPLVIAEALRGKKNSAKSLKTKVKDKSKKDQYLLKRRDESDRSKETQFHNMQLDSLASITSVERASDLESGDYVLQMRSPTTTSVKTHLPLIENMESLDQTNLKASIKNESDTLNEIKPPGPSHDAIMSGSSFQPKAEEASAFKHNGSAQAVQNVEDIHGAQKNPSVAGAPQSMQPVESVSLHEAKGLGSSKKVVVKKAKAPKRSIGEVGSDKAILEEKKIKKKKRKTEMEGHPDRRVATGKADPFSPIVDGREKDVACTSMPGAVVNRSLVVSANPDLKLQDVLSDLKHFALDPYYGAERNSPVVAKQIFLKFRSLVYQKSLSLAPKKESDSANAESSKSAAIGTLPDIAKDKAIKKPARPPGRPDDPTKGGRKRPPSDRQEEIASKKSKKINDIRSLANEKKAVPKMLEPDRKEKETSILGKETSILGKPPKMTKHVPPPRRVQPPPRVPEPTMLVLKFPQGTNMPTVAALKARFARFGPLDLDSMRVFWQSSTCRVVFRFKADAQKAYEFAVSNTSLFGSGNIRCQLREVGVPEPETKEETKEEAYPELPRYEPPLPPSSQLKSILKKSSGDETGHAPPNSSRANARVKFVLDGEESSRGGEQASMMMASRNYVNGNNIASFGDSSRPPSTTNSVAMDYNSRNMQKAIPLSSSSSMPPTNMPQQQHQFMLSAPQHEPTNPYYQHHASYGVAKPASSGSGSVDISQQLISMLTRCNEVVTNIKARLGYVPYHSL